MKRVFRIFVFIFVLAVLIFLLYCNNLGLANKETVSYYHTLKKVLKDKGYKARLLVVSTKRFSFHNTILVKFSGAAARSKHLNGDAIDFIVFDINDDGDWNSKDVDIVRRILVNEIMKDKGGIGTYQNEGSFIYRQMMHIDCRNGKARWAE